MTKETTRSGPASRSRGPWTLAAFLLSVSTALTGCFGKAEAPSLASPAGPGSGEPFLFSAGSTLWMTWTEASAGGHRVLAARNPGDGWEPPIPIAEGDDFFVNWADFPAVHVAGDTLVVHWLQRGSQGGYDYGIRLSWSTDGGETWSPPWTPHEDDTPTEHGFVSFFSGPDGLSAVWLDGRNMVASDGGHGGAGAMTIRTRVLPIGREAGEETLLDARTCECCQTDATVADGVPVVVYRDRGEGEVRNIHVTRLVDGRWTADEPVHDDGWVIGGCPVNGPAVAADGPGVAVAWFTAPGDEAQVNVAFSSNGGSDFGPPVRVDQGAPAGRVDVLALGGGDVIVTWLERRGGDTEILSRRVSPDGRTGDIVSLAVTSEGRASGFPRMARFGADAVAVAWTDPTEPGQVHVSARALDTWGLPS